MTLQKLLDEIKGLKELDFESKSLGYDSVYDIELKGIKETVKAVDTSHYVHTNLSKVWQQIKEELNINKNE